MDKCTKTGSVMGHVHSMLFTTYELMCLQLLAEGATAAEIAKNLGLHATSVQYYLNNLAIKCGKTVCSPQLIVELEV